MDRLSPFAKAIVGAAVAFTGAVATGAVDNAITLGEWWAAIAAGTAAGGAVFGIRNSMRG